ncbi:MAG TPA: integrin alpha [Kofleriaceae bacterium]|nr:integrin alpha [Kofleriaceae bacterium]
MLIGLIATGCDDAVLCDANPLIVIQTPTSAIMTDVDLAAPGVQTDVHVRSTLLPTDQIELKVLDGAGTEVATYELPVGDGAETVFASVTVPGPRARLRAVGRSGCGSAEDAVELDVAGGPSCSIAVVSPTTTVTADANPAAAGSQVDIQLAVDTACAGRMVTSTCGGGAPQGVVPADGRLTLRADLCDGSPCEVRSTCTFHVSTSQGVASQATAMIAFDDLGPAMNVAVFDPVVACGGQVAPTADVDPNTPGMQIKVRVTAANPMDAMMPMLELSNTGGLVSTPVTGDLVVTIAPGLNVLTGVATDRHGNRGKSQSCTIAHTNITLTVDPPASDGVLGQKDGTVAGNTLTFPLCGIVGDPTAAVAVRVDGGPLQPATVTGTRWCLSLTLPEAPHDVTVSATKGLSYGGAQLPLVVDLTPPPLIPGVAPLVPNRQRVGMTWSSPSDNGVSVARYLVKMSTTPLTEAGFDTEGTEILMGVPRVPGAIETAEVFPARLGTSYWIGAASYDFAGNRSAPVIVGPLTSAFQQLGPLSGPNVGQGSLAMGSAIAHGKFNFDEYDDLAIAAPTQDSSTGVLSVGAVYVYFGGPGGLPSLPSVSILGTMVGERVGASLTTVRWNVSNRDDLVIGAPGADGGAGRVYVFRGGSGFPTGTVLAESALLQLGVSSTAPGWFAGAALGTAVAGADLDGDGTRDIVASAAKGGGGTGGIVIFYGGTVTASVELSDIDPLGLGTAVVEYMPDPLAQPNRAFGTYLHSVGPTRGLLDPDDDLVVGYEDDTSTTDRVYIVRGDGTRPGASGLSLRPFKIGRDVRIELVSPYQFTELGAQAVSVSDLNGDGSPEVVISAFRHLNGGGQVLIIDGDNTGNISGVAKTTDVGVVVTRIDGSSGMRLGAVLIAHDDRLGNGTDIDSDDIDGDGLGDLLIGAASPTGGAARLHVWFGGSIPTGITTVASANAAILGPSSKFLLQARTRGPAGQGRWIGDTNGDSLPDLCWASPNDNATLFDGSFAVLFDGLP